MTSSRMPTDHDGNAIPVTVVKTPHKISAVTANGNAKNTTAFNEKSTHVYFHSAEPFYFKFGDASVSAANTDFHAPGVNQLFALAIPLGTTHVALMADGTDTTVHLWEG